MIKAKDLMIGDYINSSFGIAQVISIDKVGVTLINKDNGEFDIDFLDNDAWLQEILLTPEILEKNGFKSEGYFGKLDIEDFHVLCDTKNVAIFHNEHTDVDIPIMYVHELQHALRLCGIKKEIEL